MKKISLMYILVFTLGLTLTVTASSPRVVIPFISNPPEIDGNLSDAIWEQSVLVQDFKMAGTIDPAPLRTVVRLLCDGKFLYAGFDCEEPEINRVREAMKSFQEASWDADLVEMHFDIPHGGSQYRECVINPNGLGAAGFVMDETAAQQFRSAAHYRDNAWTAEIALPLKAYGVDPLNTQVVWGANIRRFRTFFDSQLDESYQWAGNPAGMTDTSGYGEFVLGPDTGLIIESLRCDAEGIGQGNPVPVLFSNPGKSRSVSVLADSLGTLSEKTLFQIDPGSSQKIAALPLSASPVEPSVTFTVVDEESGKILYRRRDYAILPPALSVRFTRPAAYRGNLFPGMDTLQGEISLGFTEKELRDSHFEIAVLHDSRILSSQNQSITSRTIPFSFKASLFKPGENRLLLAVVNSSGDTRTSMQCPIQKYSESDLPTISARLDENLRLIVKGEPFFPLGWYSGHNPDHLQEIAESGIFNCILDYGINNLSLDEIQDYLNRADRLNMKVVFCCNDLYPGATYIPQKSVWSGNREIAETTLRAFRDHPSVITWYLNDELPLSLVPELLNYDNQFRTGAPNQPTLMVHYTTMVLKEMARTVDIIGLDHYPVPRNPLTEISDYVDQGYKASLGLKPVWMVLQAFAWYQYRDPKTPVEGNPRARIPSEEELLGGRAPTREEARCMTYLALTHNAKGLFYYCYYDMHVLPQYAEMWAWMKEIGSEVKTLFPVLLSTDTIPSRCDESGIHHLARKSGNAITLLAVNGSQNTVSTTITLTSNDGRTMFSGMAEVLFENRMVPITQGCIQDTFSPQAVHVYRLTEK